VLSYLLQRPIQYRCSLRVRAAKIFKFLNKTKLFAAELPFVARCASYTYKVRNKAVSWQTSTTTKRRPQFRFALKCASTA